MTLLPRLLADTRAVAAAEMALVLPAFAFITLNVADLGFYIFTKMQVDLAAQAAVAAVRETCDQPTELPATVGTNCTGLDAAMSGGLQSTTLGSAVTEKSGSRSERYFCANTSGTLVDVGAVTAAPPANCSAVVATSTAKPGDYIKVTATYSFTSIFPGASVASHLTSPIERTAWMRLK